jgi:hypothetical protein
LANNLFNHLLQHFPCTRGGLTRKRREAERAAKRFTSWAQFAMWFRQLGRADSLREISPVDAEMMRQMSAGLASQVPAFPACSSTLRNCNKSWNK